MATALIVDDSKLARVLASRLLREAGYETVEAENDRQGVDRALELQPDVILMDMLMPVMDGIEALTELQQRGMNIPVIVLTADIQATVRETCLNLGAAGFLIKPVNKANLMAALVPLQKRFRSSQLEVSDDQKDAFREILNIGVGKAASSLSEMLDCPIKLEVPVVSVYTADAIVHGIRELSAERLASVRLDFRGQVNGTAALIFPPVSAVKLVSGLTGEVPGSPDMDSVMAGTLNEVGNVVLNCVMGTVGNLLYTHFDYYLPNYLEGSLSELMGSRAPHEQGVLIVVQTVFTVESMQAEGSVFLIFDLESFDAMMEGLSRHYAVK